MGRAEHHCLVSLHYQPPCVLCELAGSVRNRLCCVLTRSGYLRRPGVVHCRNADLLAQVRRLTGLAHLTYAGVARRKYHYVFVADLSVGLAGARVGPGSDCL